MHKTAVMIILPTKIAKIKKTVNVRSVEVVT